MNGPDGKPVTIWAPPSVQRDDKYQSVAALVVAKGPQAYSGAKFPEGPWCRVGSGNVDMGEVRALAGPGWRFGNVQAQRCIFIHGFLYARSCRVYRRGS